MWLFFGGPHRACARKKWKQNKTMKYFMKKKKIEWQIYTKKKIKKKIGS